MENVTRTELKRKYKETEKREHKKARTITERSKENWRKLERCVKKHKKKGTEEN